MKLRAVLCIVLALVSGCGSDVSVLPSSAPVAGQSSVPSSRGPGAGATVAPGQRTPATPNSQPTTGVPGNPTPILRPTLDLPRVTAPLTPAGTDTLGAPSWVQAGTRVTFYQAAASITQSNFAWVEDPNGNWTDPKTGITYRRTDETGEGLPTASGDGLSQLDVVALDGTDVVITDTLYGIDHNYNQFVLGPGTGGRVSGKVVDGSWIQPDLLAQLATQSIGGLLVLRGPYPLNGVTYNAISFANPTPGAYSSYTYDSVTGLLLSATTSTAGPTSPLSAPNEPPPQGNTQLTVTRLAGVRQRSMPGVNGTNPPWVARTGTLDYSGTYNFTNPVDPSSANITFPMTLSASFTGGGTNWAGFTEQELIQQPGGQTQQSSGVTGTTGVYWVDPAGLTGLSVGQVLDSDPLTGEQDTVLSIDPGPNGGNAITLDAKLPGVDSQTTYDSETGVLLQLILTTASNGTTIRLSLQQLPQQGLGLTRPRRAAASPAELQGRVESTSKASISTLGRPGVPLATMVIR